MAALKTHPTLSGIEQGIFLREKELDVDALCALPAGPRYVFAADQQHHYTQHVTHIQSAAFDRFLDVSLRPQALVLGSTTLQRHAQYKIENDFPDYEKQDLGDHLDTSNLMEEILFYVAKQDGQGLEGYFNVSKIQKDWSDEDWQNYFEKLNSASFLSILQELEKYYATQDAKPLEPTSQGNHDGSFCGNAIDHEPYPRQIRARISQAERRIKYYEKWHGKWAEINPFHPLLEEYIAEIGLQQNWIEHWQERLSYAEEHKEIYLSEGFKIGFPRSLVNTILGIRGLRFVRNKNSSWQATAGGVQNVVDKRQDLEIYLRLRYPEIDLHYASIPQNNVDHHLEESEKSESAHANEHEHPTFWPFVSRMEFAESEPFDLMQDDFSVHTVPQDSDLGFIKREDGEYAIEIHEFSGARTSEELFPYFWREIRPGVWHCLIDYPHRDSEHAQEHLISIQAVRRQSQYDGKNVYSIFLDGMDQTQEEVEITFFGSMSRLQRQLKDLFMDEMQRRDQGNCLFDTDEHFALAKHSKSFWKKFGWQESFAREENLPFHFVGHGHERKIFDETKPDILGVKNFLFGTKPVKGKSQFWSVMTPSTTDAPNEYMTTEYVRHPLTRQDYLVVRYHPLLEEDEIERMSPEVLQAVADLDEITSSHHYRDYADEKGVFSSINNLLLYSGEYITAYDSIPMSIGRFKETISIAEKTHHLLLKEFGADDSFTQLYGRTVDQLKINLELFLNGDPNFSAAEGADIFEKDEVHYRQLGWYQAQEKVKSIKSRQDQWNFLSHFNFIFETPAYARLLLLNATLPHSSQAFDFQLLLAVRAARQESETESDVGSIVTIPFEMKEEPTSIPQLERCVIEETAQTAESPRSGEKFKSSHTIISMLRFKFPAAP